MPLNDACPPRRGPGPLGEGVNPRDLEPHNSGGSLGAVVPPPKDPAEQEHRFFDRVELDPSGQADILRGDASSDVAPVDASSQRISAGGAASPTLLNVEGPRQIALERAGGLPKRDPDPVEPEQPLEHAGIFPPMEQLEQEVEQEQEREQLEQEVELEFLKEDQELALQQARLEQLAQSGETPEDFDRLALDQVWPKTSPLGRARMEDVRAAAPTSTVPSLVPWSREGDNAVVPRAEAQEKFRRPRTDGEQELEHQELALQLSAATEQLAEVWANYTPEDFDRLAPRLAPNDQFALEEAATRARAAAPPTVPKIVPWEQDNTVNTHMSKRGRRHVERRTEGSGEDDMPEAQGRAQGKTESSVLKELESSVLAQAELESSVLKELAQAELESPHPRSTSLHDSASVGRCGGTLQLVRQFRLAIVPPQCTGGGLWQGGTAGARAELEDGRRAEQDPFLKQGLGCETENKEAEQQLQEAEQQLQAERLKQGLLEIETEGLLKKEVLLKQELWRQTVRTKATAAEAVLRSRGKVSSPAAAIQLVKQRAADAEALEEDGESGGAAEAPPPFKRYHAEVQVLRGPEVREVPAQRDFFEDLHERMLAGRSFRPGERMGYRIGRERRAQLARTASGGGGAEGEAVEDGGGSRTPSPAAIQLLREEGYNSFSGGDATPAGIQHRRSALNHPLNQDLEEQDKQGLEDLPQDLYGVEEPVRLEQGVRCGPRCVRCLRSAASGPCALRRQRAEGEAVEDGGGGSGRAGEAASGGGGGSTAGGGDTPSPAALQVLREKVRSALNHGVENVNQGAEEQDKQGLEEQDSTQGLEEQGGVLLKHEKLLQQGEPLQQETETACAVSRDRDRSFFERQRLYRWAETEIPPF